MFGKIIDNQTHELIQYTHVVNLKTNRGALTNSKGFFMLQVSKGDYIKLSYIGYNDYYYQINIASSDTITFILSQKVFELKQVDVYPWTRDEFKHEFITHDVKKDSIDILKDWINLPASELTRLKYTGIPIFSNFKTSKEKQIAKLEALKKWLIQEEKYRKLVVEITAYKGLELNLFITYCNFSKRYISYARSYYLTLAIKNKYLEFEKIKSKNDK